jgi:glycosyltransferase involved in cell wall biosynthesis
LNTRPATANFLHTALIDKLGLKNEVDLLGAASKRRVLEELRRAHMFALASHCERLGVAIMEALSCGTPVIATNASGVPEIIDHNQSGYLVAPKSVEAIADAVMALINDRSLQKRFSEAGRTKFIEKFNSDISAGELKNLLDIVADSDEEMQNLYDRAPY